MQTSSPMQFTKIQLQTQTWNIYLHLFLHSHLQYSLN